MTTTGMTSNAPAAAAPTIFALNPPKAVTNLYDYTTTTKDAKLCASAAAALTTKHDGTVATLRVMLDELALRSNEFGWGALLLVKDFDNARMHDLVITSNRMIKMEDIIRASTGYINRTNRMAQDNHIMVACIVNFLSQRELKLSAIPSIHTSRAQPRALPCSSRVSASTVKLKTPPPLFSSASA